MQLPLVVACLLALALICLADVLTPVNVVFEGLALVVVGINAWLVGVRWVVAVTAAAVVLNLLRAVAGSTAVVTVLIDSVGLVASAFFAHVAAANTAETRRSRERQLAILLDTARGLNEIAELPQVYEKVIAAAAAFVSHGDPRATFWQLEPGGLRAVDETDVRGPVLLSRAPLPVSPHLRSILDGPEAHLVDVDRLEPATRELLAGHGVRSMAMSPVRVEGEIFGALTASSRDETPFTRSQLATLSGLADLAGIAVAKASELQRQRDRARVLEVLHQILVATVGAGGLKEVAQHIVSETQTLLGADTVVLALRERGRPGVWIRASTRDLPMVALEPEGVLGAVARGDTQVVKAAGDLAPGSAEAAIVESAGHLAAAPVRGGEGPLGVLAAAFDGERVTDEQRQLLALLASQVGSAIEAAELRGELVESNRAFRSLCAGLGCGAVLHDTAGQPVEVNWAAEQLTGVPVAEIAARGVFGADWTLRSDGGTEIPLPMRPPAYVLKFDRPLVGLVAEVTPPGGRPRWLRIDANPILEADRLKWIVTTFYPVPAPAPARRRA